MDRILWFILLLSMHAVAADDAVAENRVGTADAAGLKNDDRTLVPASTSGSEGEAERRREKCRSEVGKYQAGMATLDSSVTYAPAERNFAGATAGQSQVQADITINEDNSRAVVSYSGSSSGAVPECGGKDALYATNWSLKLSFPINDENTGSAMIVTGDGLSSGYSATFEWGWMKKSLAFIDHLSRNPDFGALCREAGLDQGRCSKSAILAAADAAGEDGDITAAKKLRHAYYDFRAKNYSTIRSYAVTAELGHDTFDYLTPQMGEKSVDHIDWRVGASASFVMPSRRFRYALGADYGRSHRPGRDVILCPSASGPDPVECVSGPLGPPTEQTRKVIWAEARGGLAALGYSLKVAHDFESDTTGVDLPIYLLRNANGALTGGVRIGWSEETDVVYGIFLSSPLSLKP